MIRFLLYLILGLASSVFLLTYGADRLSQPSDLSVFIGVAEILLAIILVALIIRYIYLQLTLNK
ncbi:hypothetical protein EOD41_01270 [Mucilaginibacter limnophilus]|uniref:Uncharacterized protein n=1 Tax=Mucilaginibacter limnophilus TaxID=1932778 RepID=A0A3S3TJP2_9SPHI|nr:hypothetical protein [Mucilaginibacter limnophilus]RVU02600.1 hypothetical protein EOD41_01270 [Mucilaginibacter limnophilus]